MLNPVRVIVMYTEPNSCARILLQALQRSEEISTSALNILEAQLSQAHDAALHLEAHASMLEAALFDAESSLASTQRQHASSSAALDDALAAAGAQLTLTCRGRLDHSSGGLDLEHSNLDPDLVSSNAHQTQLLLTGLRERLEGSERQRRLLSEQLEGVEAENVR